MRVGIIQSCYIPWRGYFDFIDDVDMFILFDDIQFPYGRSWRNRNQIKTKDGLRWLTVPVRSGSAGSAIDHVQIGISNKPWRQTHQRLLQESLGAAPYFHDALTLWNNGTEIEEKYLSRMNGKLIQQICKYLNIRTPIIRSRDYPVEGAKTERLINLLRKVGATSYLSGLAAKDYLDEDMFRANGIQLAYKVYDYEPYPQFWGDFVGTVSVLDLIANTGKEARKYLKSLAPNKVVVR